MSTIQNVSVGQTAVTGETVYGLKAVSMPTPMWAKYTFRTVAFVTTAAAMVLLAVPMDGGTKSIVIACLKGVDYLVLNLSKMVGVEIEQVVNE